MGQFFYRTLWEKSKERLLDEPNGERHFLTSSSIKCRLLLELSCFSSLMAGDLEVEADFNDIFLMIWLLLGSLLLCFEK